MAKLGQLFGMHRDEDGREVGFTEEEFRALSTEDQLDVMQRWFHERFEDPVHELPYNSREGGYQYINGAPADANEELQDEFGTIADIDLIEQAVEELQTEGVYDWSPRRRDHDYDDLEDVALPDGDVDSDKAWPPSVAAPISISAAREAVESRLSELEAALSPFLNNTPGIGHNNPPSEIATDVPLNNSVAIQISFEIQNLRLELPKDDPDEVKVAESVGIFSKTAKALRTWIGDRLTKASDAAIGASVVLAIANAEKVLNALSNTIESISKWIELLPW